MQVLQIVFRRRWEMDCQKMQVQESCCTKGSKEEQKEREERKERGGSMNLEELKEKVEYFIRVKEEMEANPKAWVKKNSQRLAEDTGKDVKEIVKNWEDYANREQDAIRTFMFNALCDCPVEFSAVIEDQRSKDV